MWSVNLTSGEGVSLALWVPAVPVWRSRSSWFTASLSDVFLFGVQGQRGLRPRRGEAAAHGTSRSGRHLLWKLSHHAGLEIRKWNSACTLWWWFLTFSTLSLRKSVQFQFFYLVSNWTVCVRSALSLAGTSFWAESEVQGGEVHHRAVPHDKGQRLGLRGAFNLHSWLFQQKKLHPLWG